jgi:hypothetical protein
MANLRPTRRRIAANPIPYWSRGGRVDKSPAVFDEAFADYAEIGFTAVKADVPDGMNAADYLDWIGSYGLAPALSLFNSPFDETIDITEEMERAKKFAATQVELGLDRTMISSMAIPGRLDRPAVVRISTAIGCALPSRTAASSARCCSRRVYARCITPMSAGCSRPRRRSSPCSMGSART